MPAPKYTPEIHTELVKWLAVSPYKEPACRKVGIHPETLARWLAAGEKPGNKYHQLWLDVNTARADWEMRSLLKISQSNDPRVHLEFLARIEPGRYGAIQRVQVSGDADGPAVKVDTTVRRAGDLTEEERTASVLDILGDLGVVPIDAVSAVVKEQPDQEI